MKYMSMYFLLFIYLFIFSLVCLIISFYFILNDLIFFIEWNVIFYNSVMVLMTFLFDWMSLVFMGFVMFISSLVILYSGYYMSSDLNTNRFVFLVLLFVASMMFLIISPNMISILLGWDGLGLVSYCLVIYYQNNKSYNAGMLTALSNRLGDVFMLLCISWMLNFGSWNYIFYLDCYKMNVDMIVINSMILLAAMTSSAQIPFSSWLPAAMAAPTPVSALVHSSTLVTAGVYLLIRFNISFNSSLSVFLLLVSGLTMFMAGLGANFEYDLSKIIALSTLSQLGLMISTLALGYTIMSFFHLLMHALFKALLFMCAGVMIHCMKNTQDIRFMGCVSFQLPLISSCLMISNFALCGFPFLAGFYSKDLILEMVFMSYLNMFSLFLFIVSTGLTVCYSFRLYYYVMCGDFNLSSMHIMSDNNMYMYISMFFMLMLVVIGGSMFSWVIFCDPSLIILPLSLKGLVFFISILGGLIGYEISKMSFNMDLLLFKINYVINFSGSMWFMPYIFTYGISCYPLIFGYNLYKVLDFGWTEYFGGQGLIYLFMFISKINQLWQYNSLKMFMTFFVMLFIFMLVYYMSS
uniref:NADH dehydrogenase subunit 5 n=1 Tax=Allacta hainanensis TaxID=3037030 RepID=UPI0027A7B814|nr:NADH dehydrogenase subunit 5 [Allacta hainanensis]WGO56996.1 NADH dehydrogenase subunit 5 [Allacta hainanensis]